MYGGQSSYLPLKINYSGIMPVIFANAILLFPQQIRVHRRVDGRKFLSKSVRGAE
jgi:preprotein translocase subunit SecY